MIDAPTQALLQDIVRRAGRSMLQYVGEAYPWASEEEQPLLAKLREIVDDEERETEDLARFLRRHRVGLPYLGSYPDSFSHLNYVSLDYLLPKLLDHQRKTNAVLERDLEKVQEPVIKEEVSKLLAAGHRHLAALDQMAANHAKNGAH